MGGELLFCMGSPSSNSVWLALINSTDCMVEFIKDFWREGRPWKICFRGFFFLPLNSCKVTHLDGLKIFDKCAAWFFECIDPWLGLCLLSLECCSFLELHLLELCLLSRQYPPLSNVYFNSDVIAMSHFCKPCNCSVDHGWCGDVLDENMNYQNGLHSLMPPISFNNVSHMINSLI